ncbi:MAG: hypothetical protein FD149_364 [Rhodospirillaceae bacterium]|nr:MAG: hypothetical protein FD149_364 [Rhodospirillaceae bacterium]
MADMVFHERAHKEISVIIPFVTAQVEWIARFLTGEFEHVRVKLHIHERVGHALIDQNGRAVRRIGDPADKKGGIISFPRAAVGAKIGA